MTTIVTTVIISSEEVKMVNQETNFCSFKVYENLGTKEHPKYINYECSGNFSGKQIEYLKKDTVIEIIGNITDVNAYLSKTQEPRAEIKLNVLKFQFKGKVNRDSEAVEEQKESEQDPN